MFAGIFSCISMSLTMRSIIFNFRDFLLLLTTNLLKIFLTASSCYCVHIYFSCLHFGIFIRLLCCWRNITAKGSKGFFFFCFNIFISFLFTLLHSSSIVVDFFLIKRKYYSGFYVFIFIYKQNFLQLTTRYIKQLWLLICLHIKKKFEVK